MFANLLGIDKEKITHDTIQTTLENVGEELKCEAKDFFIMIKPIMVEDSMEMKFYIYKLENGSPKPIREMTLKEILGSE